MKDESVNNAVYQIDWVYITNFIREIEKEVFHDLYGDLEDYEIMDSLCGVKSDRKITLPENWKPITKEGAKP